jgi:predicted ATPase
MMVKRLLREDANYLGEAETLIDHTRQNGIAGWTRLGGVYLGRALVAHGKHQEGIALISEGVKALLGRSEHLSLQYAAWMLADAHLLIGEVALGLEIVEQALAWAESKHIRFNEPDLHRLRGELFLRLEEAELGEADQCFRRAIEVSRQQGAKSWELRATTSLARLLDKQGKRAEAHKMLADIYDWFSEGFDTADLQEARILLDELSD